LILSAAVLRGDLILTTEQRWRVRVRGVGGALIPMLRRLLVRRRPWLVAAW
jgi:hypothetical protein